VSLAFVGLPGFWSGFGADVNYTFIDSSQISTKTNRKQQITGLANNTWNITGYYDRGPLLVRVAYAINTSFINNDNLGSPLGGAEIFGPQDTADATVQYALSSRLRLIFNVLNATQPVVGYYDTYPEQPHNTYRTYRRLQAGLKFSF
jgi:hypothetical protein